jgi:hypothetical protein
MRFEIDVQSKRATKVQRQLDTLTDHVRDSQRVRKRKRGAEPAI